MFSGNEDPPEVMHMDEEMEERELEGELEEDFPEFEGRPFDQVLDGEPINSIMARRELMEDARGVLETLETSARLRQTAKSMNSFANQSHIMMPRAWQVFVRWAGF